MSKSIVNNQTVNALLKLAVVFTIVGTLIPVATVVLRIVNYQWLQNTSPGYIVMNPLTSICLTLMGTALWLVRKESNTIEILGIPFNYISKICCLIIISICLSKIIFLIFDWHFKLDHLLFSDQLKIPEQLNLKVKYNSMGINTSICLIMLAVSLIYIDKKNPWVYANPQTLNYVVIFVAILTIYGYIYKVEDLYTTLGRIPMSFLAAISLLLISSAVLFFRPYQGTMAHLIGQNPTEVFLMRFLAFIIPLLIGFFKIKGQENHIFNEEFGTAIIATTTYLISMTLLGWKTNIQYQLQTAKVDKFRIIKNERKKLNRILNMSKTHIQILDITKERFVFSNDVATKGGKRKEEIESANYSELLKEITHPDDFKLHDERLERLKELKDDEYDDLIFRTTSEEGGTVWLYSRGIVFKRTDGKATQFLFNSIDITKQKEAELELKKKKKILEEKQEKLSEAKEKLEEAQKNLKNKVKEREEDLVKSEKRYRSYIQNSFDGIIQYEHKGKDLPIDLPVDEMIKQVKDKTYIAKANKIAADNLGYESPKDLKGVLFTEITQKVPEKVIDENIKKFAENNFRLFGIEPILATKGGKKFKTYINLLGIVKDKKLVKIWEIQSSSKIKEVD